MQLREDLLNSREVLRQYALLRHLEKRVFLVTTTFPLTSRISLRILTESFADIPIKLVRKMARALSRSVFKSSIMPFFSAFVNINTSTTKGGRFQAGFIPYMEPTFINLFKIYSIVLASRVSIFIPGPIVVLIVRDLK